MLAKLKLDILRQAHMSAHQLVSQAVGDGDHPSVDGSPPSAICGRRSGSFAPACKGWVRLHKPQLIPPLIPRNFHGNYLNQLLIKVVQLFGNEV